MAKDQSCHKLVSVDYLLCESRQQLKQANIASYQIDPLILLQEICSLTKEQIIFNKDLCISNVLANKFLESIKLRKKSMPVAKIIGKKDFFDSSFIVSEDVLDPRPDSEILIETVIDNFRDDLQKFTILELGTGSGCLVLSLLKIYKNSQAVAVDISQKALAIANKNANNLLISDQLTLVESDLFDEITDKFDLIISNPPYIAAKEIEELSLDTKYDPEIALNGGVDGLDFYRRIAQNANKYLNNNGKIIVEIGCNQENDVKDIFLQNNFVFQDERKDLAGIIRVLTFYAKN